MLVAGWTFATGPIAAGAEEADAVAAISTANRIPPIFPMPRV
jgi:hypothetical protein